MYFKDVAYARNCLVSALAKPKQHVYKRVTLTHLSRMEFPTDIISSFRVVGWYFSFYSKFERNFCKQTVENQIRRCVLRRLIWFYTVCRFPTKRTLGLYGLRRNLSVSREISDQLEGRRRKSKRLKVAKENGLMK